jgi:hypothetical protein
LKNGWLFSSDMIGYSLNMVIAARHASMTCRIGAIRAAHRGRRRTGLF